MARFLLWVFASFITGCCVFAGARHPGERQTLAEQIKEKTVAFVYYDRGDDALHTYCAGVWVSHDQIVTAAHCVRVPFNAKDIKQWKGVGRRVEYSTPEDVVAGDAPSYLHGAYVEAYDYERDIALVKVDKDDLPKDQRDHVYAMISKDELHMGDSVHTVGSTFGYWWTYMRGNISMPERHDVARDLYQHDFKSMQINTFVTNGNSGGGCFDDNGMLEGIVSFVDPRRPGIGFCIHRDVVREFLEENRISR